MPMSERVLPFLRMTDGPYPSVLPSAIWRDLLVQFEAGKIMGRGIVCRAYLLACIP